MLCYIHNIHIKMILLTNNFYAKKSSAFAGIYLLASVMYCDLFEGNSFCYNNACCIDSGVQHDYLCNINLYHK